MNNLRMMLEETQPIRHNCGKPEWPHCCVCDGRMHEPGCTARMNKNKDCCPARHKMLHDAGQTRGIGDDSQAMWSPEEQQGFHDPHKVEAGPVDPKQCIHCHKTLQRHGSFARCSGGETQFTPS